MAATINGRVFEDVNYGGGAGRAFGAFGSVGVGGVSIEVYSGNTYLTTITTAADGTYSYNYPGSNAARTLRVVNGTVRSSRNAACTTCVPVQIFRTTGNGNTADPITNRVGGENPALNDAAANTTSATLSSLTNATRTPQSVATFDPTANGSVINNADFGFNFDTIVNRSDATTCTPTTGTPATYYPCQGSLRQFIINSNALTGEGSLAQSGNRILDNVTSTLPAGYETSVFMIPSGALSSGAALITLAGTLPTVSGTSTRLDASTQTATGGNTNGGTVGGGNVGVDNLSLPAFQLPEVELTAGNTTVTLNGPDQSIVGFALAQGYIVMSGSNAVANGNLVGFTAEGVSSSGATTYGIAFTGSNTLIRHNYVAVNNSGIRCDNPGPGSTIEYNEVSRPDVGHSDTYDGILVIGTASGITINANLTRDQRGGGIEIGFGPGTMSAITISNNTVRNNGFNSGTTASSEPVGIAGYNYTGAGVVISRNRIENNAGAGVMLNLASGTTAITQNVFSNNGGLSIDLDTRTLPAGDGPNLMNTLNGPTLNDSGDGDSMPNGLLNFPVITAATLVNGQLSIAGFARPGSTIELYIAQPDPSGFGEGLTYLGQYIEGTGDDDSTTGSYSGTINGVNQGSDTTNRFLFRIPAPASVTAGVVLASTATLSGQTSEFGGNVTVTGGPNLVHTKTVAVESDPLNNTSNPKSIPGAIQLYTVRVTNQGAGTVDNDSLQIVDAIPANTSLCGLAGAPVTFTNGTPVSGLTFSFTTLNDAADGVDFSNTTSGIPTWTYVPAPTNGCDANVHYIRIKPRGTMAGAGGSGNPYFEVRFRVRVQ